MEKTQPRIFHIHVDGQNMPLGLYDYAVKELAFVPSDYNGHPEGYYHAEPVHHLTLKVATKELFNSVWKQLEEKLSGFPEFKGYIEGEYIPIDEFIPYKTYTGMPVPYEIKTRKLNDSNNEHFRQTEIHVTMERTGSDPDLMKELLDAGLYGAFIPKYDGEFLVLTMQGYIKEIVPLIETTRNYLITAGGANRCTIKEERAIAYKLCHIDSVDLPEIAAEIRYK